MDTQAEEKKVLGASTLSNILDYVEIFVIAICAVIVLFSGIIRICTVDGHSMNNTLQNGETLVVSDTFYTPERGDIVVFHQTDNSFIADSNKPLVKRVIGIGGDTVRIDFTTWTVTVTDKNGDTFTLKEDYMFLDPERSDYFSGIKEYTVPEGSLFVLGDNRRNSLDSRFSNIGFVDARRVLGKVVLRASPISSFGTVN